jgi:hypothetical protein
VYNHFLKLSNLWFILYMNATNTEVIIQFV